jgi:purine-binding chemotaxis protein CheW
MGDQIDGGAVERQIIAFTLSHEAFGIDIVQVQRIAPPETITRVPRAPDFISGIMNLAGRIITLIDLSRILHLGKDEDAGQQIIILNHEDMNIGFVTGQVTDVIMTDDESLNREIIRIGAQEENFVSAVLKTEDRIINVLNVDKLFDFVRKSFIDSRGK